MLAELKDRAVDSLERRLGAVRGLTAGISSENLRALAPHVGHLGQLARLQLGLFDFRMLLPVLLARELGVFEALSDRPMTSAQVAQRCQMVDAAAESLLRVLESQQLVVFDGGRARLSDFAAVFLRPGRRVSLVPVVDLLRVYAKAFGEICDAMRSGQTPASLDVQSDGATTDLLLQAVNTHVFHAAAEFLRKADLPELDQFIVGSMGVSFSAAVLDAFPDAQVTYGCLPHLVERIPRLCEVYGVDESRVVDMHPHSGAPEGDKWGHEAFDLVFLTRKMILDPAERVGERFAQKAFEVLEPGGVAVFWEAVHPDEGPSGLPLALETFFDLGMSPTAPLKRRGGFERTLREVGFDRVDYVECLGGSTVFAVAHKGRS